MNAWNSTKVFLYLRRTKNKFIDYYSTLLHKFESSVKLKEKHLNDVKQKVMNSTGYKYRTYLRFNPNLQASKILNKSYAYAFYRVILSSHMFPIETGRWTGIERNLRLCERCDVIGDEFHFIYECDDINRINLNDTPNPEKLQDYKKLILLKEFIDKKYL